MCLDGEKKEKCFPPWQQAGGGGGGWRKRERTLSRPGEEGSNGCGIAGEEKSRFSTPGERLLKLNAKNDPRDVMGGSIGQSPVLIVCVIAKINK